MVTYGDTQKFGKVYILINKYMSSTIQLRCNCHILRKFHDANVPSKSGFNEYHEYNYNLVIVILCQWMYSWVKSYYLTESEYNKSKYLFQNYLDSYHIASHMLINGINKIKDFGLMKISFHMIIVKFFYEKVYTPHLPKQKQCCWGK